MIQEAQDYHQVVALFNKYLKHKTTRVPTQPGFYKFLLIEHSMPAWLVSSLKKQIKLDPRLSFHVNTILEEFLLTGMLTGTLKEGACKLILKNKHGYEESPTRLDDTTAVTTRQVTYRAATLEDVKLLESK